MKKFIHEIAEEFILVFKGKTLDTLIPPIVFLISLNVFNLNIALIISFSLSLIILLYRMIKKENQKYALFGIIALGIASIFSYLGNNPSTYFIPDILGSAISLLLAIISLIFKKPLAAYASHFTRGWPLTWFWRKDVRPAYMEVTVLWAFYFLLRTSVEITFFINNDVQNFVWFNTLIGFPLLIGILTISYIYGIWRLRKLNGPGVDEFIENKEPPYRGQTRGF